MSKKYQFSIKLQDSIIKENKFCPLQAHKRKKINMLRNRYTSLNDGDECLETNKHRSGDVRDVLKQNENIGSQKPQKTKSAWKTQKNTKSDVKFEQRVKVLGGQSQCKDEIIVQQSNRSKAQPHKPSSPSINRILSASDKSLRIISSNQSSRRVSKNMQTINQYDNQLYKRRTCKMFHLKWRTDQKVKSQNIINNLISSLKNSKFFEIEDKENFYKGKKQKSLKMLSFYDKAQQQKSQKQGNINERMVEIEQKQHMKRRGHKKMTNAVRRSRFSLKTEEEKAENLPSVHNQSEKQREHGLKQSCRKVKFLQIKNQAKNHFKNEPRIEWKVWRKHHKNTQFNKNTENSQKNMANKHIQQQCKSIYGQSLRQKERQLHHLQKLQSNLNKFNHNQMLIDGLKAQHQQFIDNYFQNIEQQFIKYDKLINVKDMDEDNSSGWNQMGSNSFQTPNDSNIIF